MVFIWGIIPIAGLRFQVSELLSLAQKYGDFLKYG
jgi:hypothetical protein